MQSPSNLEALSSPLNVPYTHAQGVIDIGSHSVRMVVYHAPVRVPLPLFNEKYYCALGQGLATTGKLNPKGVTLAHKVLARFMVMARRLGVDDITILATAAIRDAQDGAAFVQKVEQGCGVSITVLSGEEEAELAAKGVIASIHHPVGISADLGGGSIELAHINGADIREQSSFEVGALRLVDIGEDNPAAMAELIDRELGSIDWLSNVNSETIYAVGGSFRTIAKMHMRQTGYSLPILHEYCLSREEIDRVVALYGTLSSKEISELPSVPKKRAKTMFPAALVLQHLMQCSQAKRVVFSVSGIREGFLYGQLSSKQKQEDPLFSSAADLASLAGRHGHYADELFSWMQPLFAEESGREQRIRYALCILSELAWTVDPNFRAKWAYHRVIQSSIKGLNHRERVMLASALFHRYKVKCKNDRETLQLFSERDHLWAKCVGMVANLAFHISGGKQGNLHHAKLEVSGCDVGLSLDEEASPMRTEALEKRLEGLGSNFKALSSFEM